MADSKQPKSPLARAQYLAPILFLASFTACGRERAPATAQEEAPPPASTARGPEDSLPFEEPAGDPGIRPVPRAELPAPAKASGSSDRRSVLGELDEYAKKHGGRARGIFIDLESGQTLAEVDANHAVNPASTQKLITAAAALELLGPGYTFSTELRGEIKEDGPSSVTLVGGGAPDLETSDLLLFAHALRSRGITQIGDIYVDQSRFDGRFVPPAFEEQPGEWAAFRAPVSALALARNTVSLHVVSTKKGEPAKVWLDPPGVSVLAGQVKTRDAQDGDKVIWELAPQADAPELSSKVSGGLGAGLGHRSYQRRLHDPLLSPGLAFRELLKESGATVEGKVVLASQAQGSAKPELITRVRSKPLSVLVRELGKDSDNFTAEMLALALSQADGGAANAPWSTERGVLRMKKWLEEVGIDTSGLTLRNGSGLFGANLVTCQALARVLEKMAAHSAASPEFMSQLAIGGSDGTLRNRFVSGALSQKVRAKTGTLADTIALAGYLLRGEGRRPIVFCTIVSGVRGRHTEVRGRIDRALQSFESQVKAGPAAADKPKAVRTEP